MGPAEDFAKRNGFAIKGKISKGWTSEIFLAMKGKKRVVLKALREKSNRKGMALRESENLKIANSAGVGPKLIAADVDCGVVAMEYIEGVRFSEWLYSGISGDELENFIDELFSQAKLLDCLGLDHGQLAGRGNNILVRGGLPVIIDFEKASAKRRVHNLKVVESFIFRSKDSAIVKRIGKILDE